MTDDAYTLQAFVSALREITAANDDATDIIKRVRPLAQRLAASPDLRARSTSPGSRQPDSRTSVHSARTILKWREQ